jgi:protein-S-isoprenylcysteine O-methyltransferase Ste14
MTDAGGDMADRRASLLVIIPPPAWALIFFLIAWQAGRLLDLPPSFREIYAGWALVIVGGAVSAAGRIAFARARTEVIPVSRKNSALVTTGPFRISRNPMYLGLLGVMIGLAFVLGTASGFAAAIVFFLFVNFISIPYEEKKMERQFGEAYLDYKARVRRWI